jgi:hypothetical protein
MDQKIRDEARLAHPDWSREKIIERALVSDTGWSKNVITDNGRRRLVTSSWDIGFNMFIHRGTQPGSVRTTNFQFVYENILPSPLAGPDFQTNSLTLLLQTRTVEFAPPPYQTGTGDSISGGPTTWTITDATGIGSGVFSPEMVGNNFTITGALNGANNSTFPIAAYISPTQIQVTGALVAETSSFSWTAGVTRTIRMVGLTQGGISGYQTGSREITGIVAYTVLGAPVTQLATQVADVSYRVTWSLD